MENTDIYRRQDQGEEISLKDLIIKFKGWNNYLRTKWITISFSILIGGLLGITYAYLKQPIYTAELTFALEEESSSGGLGGALGLAGQFGLDLGSGGGGVFEGDNLQELMKSRYIVESTLLTPIQIEGQSTTLADLYIDFNNLRNKWKDQPKLQRLSFDQNVRSSSRLRDSVLKAFYKTISSNLMVTKKDKKLSIISLTVSSSNEVFAKFFAEILANNVSDFYVETKTKRSAENLKILQNQTDSVRRALNAAISGVASSIDVNPNPNPAIQLLKVPSQRRQVDAQANQVILGELVKNLELAKIALRKETPLIQIIDRPKFPLEKKQVGKLRSFLIGSFIAGASSLLFLILTRIYRQILNE